MRLHRWMTAAVLGGVILAGHMAPAQAEEVNVYSYRQPFLIEPLLKAFTEETGIKTKVLFDDKALIERMVQEGASSPADILLTVDIGRLQAAVQSGVTQPVKSEILDANIPADFRSPDGEWFALTTRARVVYASKDRVKQDKITYEELADPKWKGKICIRSGQHVYNTALIAAMIAHHGEEKTKTWLEGLKANLARKPAGGDRDQVKGIFAGECDIALGNTYYMAKMLTNDKEPEQKQWAEASRIIFPTFENGGTHVNISGIALAKNAPNREAAIKLMEFLSSDKAQKLYAEANDEYPIKPGIEPSTIVKAWGEFTPDNVSLDEIAELRDEASKLVDEVDFDAGPQS
ncbi:Fe(3+) ABC transporter substrate-binding protein [Rhodoligotrophos ferricapiens]|uniref:Fe(3+) ABC transporter substrate-binding protein n=1 Tax=Rhodoligotrophos ferricapiens TaxID=3069264 RepID=UPI003D8141CE